MASFTLDDIRAAADAKYGSTDIPFGDETLVLRNPLRLSKEERKALTSIQESEDADAEDSMIEALTIAAADKAVAKRFLKEVNGDAGVLAVVFEKYTGEAQTGEA